MSNPEMLSKIKDAVSGLDLGMNKTDKAHEKDRPIETTANECPCDNKGRSDNASKNRRRLIEALEPYLSKERYESAKRLLLICDFIDAGECLKGR